MNYDDLVRDFIKRFPKWGVNERKELKSWSSNWDSPYIYFGDVLNPLLVKKLTDEENKEELRGIFNFLEEMATPIIKKLKQL